jgi:hypothetical protein
VELDNRTPFPARLLRFQRGEEATAPARATSLRRPMKGWRRVCCQTWRSLCRGSRHRFA